jgi:plasmid stability protein
VAKKSTETIHLKLRLPEGLRRQIEKSAARSERSMNSEILYLLQQALQFGDLEAVTRSAVETAAKQAVVDILERLEQAEKRTAAPLSVSSSNFFEALAGKKDISK